MHTIITYTMLLSLFYIILHFSCLKQLSNCLLTKFCMMLQKFNMGNFRPFREVLAIKVVIHTLVLMKHFSFCHIINYYVPTLSC